MHNELRQLNRFVFIIIYQLSFDFVDFPHARPFESKLSWLSLTREVRPAAVRPLAAYFTVSCLSSTYTDCSLLMIELTAQM